jgi:hypothetical protein
MAKGKYYTPEFKEQAVKMTVGLDCTYDLLHALQGHCFRLDAHPDRSRSARPRNHIRQIQALGFEVTLAKTP